MVTRALVLCGGGARGAYQAGVLRGIGELLPHAFHFDVVTGVSAGGINAASIAAHEGSLREAAEALARSWQRLSIDEVFSTTFGSLSWSLMRWLWMLLTGRCSVSLEGLLDTRPLARFLGGSLAFEGLRRNLDAGRLRALALSATCYRTGHTVTFVEGSEEVRPWKRARRHALPTRLGVEHVMASSALPLLFPAIRVGDGYYGDGSLRQTSPLAPAVHLGAERILAISVRYAKGDQAPVTADPVHPPPARVLGLLMHSMFLDALENDAERLHRINRTLAALPTRVATPDRLRTVQLLVLRPSRDLGELARDLEHLLPRTLRLITRGLGSRRSPAPDFLSYLLFERAYVDRLLELGRRDALRQAARIRTFLTGSPHDSGTARFRKPDLKLPAPEPGVTLERRQEDS